MKVKKIQGFTLIEVMIVVAIIGILAAIAYPSYSEYVKRGNRAEGQAFLVDIAARQERHFTQNYKYITSAKKIKDLGLSSNKSPTAKYAIAISQGQANDGGYLLTATQQFADPKCQTLTLNALGLKNSTGTRSNNSECWR